MKYEIVISNQFKRDLRQAHKRNYKIQELEAVVNKLAKDEPLDLANHDHNLAGKFSGFRECHIRPDWLLIYKKENQDLILLLMRTGTHADLYSL